MNYPGDCWPNPDQLAWLQMAVAEPNIAIEAWESWPKQYGLSQLDRSLQRLIPLAHNHLIALSVEHEYLESARALAHRTWARNQLQLQQLAGVVRRLSDSDIPSIILKGAALLINTYESAGLRPMTDVDLLVPTELAGPAIDCLRPEWLPIHYQPNADTMRFKHSLGFVSIHNGAELDLHWHLLAECIGPNDDDAFWQASLPATLPGGEPARLLEPVDQLFHTCVHGIRNDWGNAAPVWWIADAMLLIRTHRMDWDRLLATAMERKLIMPLRYGLHFLQAHFSAPIPNEVLHAFLNAPVHRRQIAEFSAKVAPFNYWHQLQIHWFNFRRLQPAALSVKVLHQFLNYVRSRWGVHGWRETFAFIRRSWRRRRRVA